MPRDTLIAIGAGLASALASMAFAGGFPFAIVLVYLAPFPLIMAGLGLGFRASLIAALVGFVSTGVFGGPTSAAIFGIVHALPSLITVNLALKSAPAQQDGTNGGVVWYPAGYIAAAIAMLGACLLIAAAIVTASGQGLSGLLSAHLGAAMKIMAPAMPEESRRAMADALVPLFPGAVVSSWAIMAVVNGALAQGALVRAGRNLRPSPSYTGTDMPGWLSWPLVGAATIALAGMVTGQTGWEYVGRNLAMVVAVPYFLLGLAVVHTLARRVARTGPLLMAFYMVIVVSIWAALVIAAVGVAEQWFGIRNRQTQTPPGGGDDEDED